MPPPERSTPLSVEIDALSFRVSSQLGLRLYASHRPNGPQHPRWDKLCTATLHPSPTLPGFGSHPALSSGPLCAHAPLHTLAYPMHMRSWEVGKKESPRPSPRMPEASPHAPNPHAPCPRRSHHRKATLSRDWQNSLQGATHTVNRLHLRQYGRAQPWLTAPTWSSPATANHRRPPPRGAVRQWCT